MLSSGLLWHDNRKDKTMFGSPHKQREPRPVAPLPLPQHQPSRQQRRANERAEKKKMSNAVQYATQTKYAGQVASVCRAVAVKLGGRVRSGVIDEIQNGEPLIALSSGGTPMVYAFEGTSSAADVGAMPDGSWTWPPRA
jgi:hypothetical protein